MNELVNLVCERTGLPQDQARLAVETVVNYLKTKLPPPLDNQIDSVLSGGSMGDTLGNLSQGLGGMFGGK